MNSLIILAIIIFVYVQIYYRLPEYLSNKTHIYFGVFVTGFIIIYYVLNYQKVFAHKVFNNMNDASNKPLYDFQGQYYKNNQQDILKVNLANKQGWRCANCQNPILQKDLNFYKMNYLKPLQYGGENNINNLGLSCTTCNTFRPY